MRTLSEVLEEWGFAEVMPMEVYSDIFHLGEGLIQCENESPGSYKANPIIYYRNNNDKKGHFRICFEDTFKQILEEAQNSDFAILNGVTYFGRRNLMTHASKMYAMIFDLDNVSDVNLDSFLSGAFNSRMYPIPNYIVLSGHGIHLYYVFEYGIP
ncbi:MAG: hypothetical protein ACI3WU_01555, partial [Phascolarctobacterium sp.]